MEEDGLDDAFEDGPNEWVSFDAGEDVVDVVDDAESAPMPPRADAKAVSATRAVVDDDDASCYVNDLRMARPIMAIRSCP